MVVGGGPSGAFAAYKLARHGARVMLLERRKVPRPKPCGGGLTPKAYRQLDFPIDDIEDLRLAVDEACALLLPHATPDTPLEARFVLATGRLEVETSVSTSGDGEPDRSGFAWTVLGALASSVDVRKHGSGNPGG